jgi:GntR family transcriptional regulator
MSWSALTCGGKGVQRSGFGAGQAPKQQLLSVRVGNASQEVAMRLDINEGSPVVIRQRLFLIDSQPVALCDSYYPADMAEGTAIAEDRRING